MKTALKFEISEHAPDPTFLSGRAVRMGQVVFCDPETRNSWQLGTADLLFKHLKRAERECDVLVFRAEGRVFCSGGNLRDHQTLGAARGRRANRRISAVLKALSLLKIPTIALVEGDVFGGGIELLSAFDFVLVTPPVQLGFWQRRLGLTFGWGGGRRLQRRLGPAHVAALALEARAITATEALRLGLVDRIVAPWVARDELDRLALALARHAKQSTSAIKLRDLNDSRKERNLFERLWFGPSHKAALDRFFSDRPL